MKTKLIILLILLVNTSIAQQIKEDSVLNKINSELPKGWVMKIKDSVMTIEKIDSVWVILTNHINEDRNLKDYKESTDEELKVKFEKVGSKHKYRFTYRIETIMSSEELKQAKTHNDLILTRTKELWNKYGIDAFYTPPKITRGKPLYNEKYAPKNAKDSLNLKKYLEESAQLETLKIIIPDKCTEKYNLFPVGESWYSSIFDNSSFVDIYPKYMSGELFRICEMITKYTDCKN